MKKRLQALLQRLLGFERYLFYFSLFKIHTLRWDKREGDFFTFHSFLRTDDHVLDIGANIGIMTSLLARRCPKGIVHAFEPIPENLDALHRILTHFKAQHVQVHNIALGNSSAQLKMQMPVMQGVKMQGLSHVMHPSIEGYQEGGDTYTVEQQRLDDLMHLLPQPVHAIKMDVENFEYFVLLGGESLLCRDKPLLYCELWDNENRAHCFRLVRRLGYRVFVHHNQGLVPFNPEHHTKQNFFFLHPENPRFPYGDSPARA